MRVTKHHHAALTVHESGKTLVVDPGSFTDPLIDLGEVVAIVVTHEHPDHWTPDHLDRLLKNSPEAPIYGPEGVAKAAAGYDITVVNPGDTVTIEPFTLRFFGGTHAVIHETIPVIDNVGVLVNNTLFYPGDSFTVPPVAVDTLAVPSAAPWLKIGEAMDYVTAVAPKRSFPTHEMVASVIGKGMANDRLRTMTEAAGGQFFPLEPNDTLDL